MKIRSLFAAPVIVVFLALSLLYQHRPVQAQSAPCVGATTAPQFVSWDSFGVVKLQYVNDSNVPMVMTDFTIVWGNIVTRAGLAPGVLTLRQVTAGGNSPADPMSAAIWQGPDLDSATGGHSEGTWVGNYSFPANSTTAIFLDFDGTSTNLQAAFGAQLSDLNGTTFTFDPDCSASGGTPPSGGGSAIALDTVNPAPSSSNDERLNRYWGDHFAVIYFTDGVGNPALRVYRVGDDGSGWLGLALNLEDLPEAGEENILVASENGIAVYILTSGEIQINVGPDAEGKVFSIVVDGLPATSVRYLP